MPTFDYMDVVGRATQEAKAVSRRPSFLRMQESSQMYPA